MTARLLLIPTVALFGIFSDLLVPFSNCHLHIPFFRSQVSFFACKFLPFPNQIVFLFPCSSSTFLPGLLQGGWKLRVQHVLFELTFFYRRREYVNFPCIALSSFCCCFLPRSLASGIFFPCYFERSPCRAFPSSLPAVPTQISFCFEILCLHFAFYSVVRTACLPARRLFSRGDFPVAVPPINLYP